MLENNQKFVDVLKSKDDLFKSILLVCPDLCPKEESKHVENPNRDVEKPLINHGNTMIKHADLYDGEVLNKEKFRNIILDYFTKLKISCFLKFGTIRENIKTKINKQVTAYAHCMYKKDHVKKFFYSLEKVSCDTFKLTATSEGIDIENHKKSKLKFRQLKGEARRKFQVENQVEAIEMINLKQAVGKDPELAEHGNTQNMVNKAVLLKARSEYRSNSDFIKNCDIGDLFAFYDGQDKDKKYLQKASNPMEAQLYSNEQINLLANGPQHLYFDATGTLVRPPQCHNHDCKRCFYYAGVIKVGGKIVPIMELITIKHDTASLICFLTNVMATIGSHKPRIKLPFSSVTIDWSWPSIHAIMIAFNNITFIEYLNIKYYNKEIELIPVFICYSHFIKIIADQIKKRFNSNYVLSSFLKDIFRVMANCTSVTDLDSVFCMFIQICCSEFSNKCVATKLKELGQILKTERVENLDESDEKEIEEWKCDYGPSQADPLYKKSPYHTKYYGLYQKCVMLIEKGEGEGCKQKNVLYCKEFCEYVIKHYMPYVVLWNYMIIGERRNNSMVENHFKNVKHIYVAGKNHKIGRFISILKEVLDLLLNYVQFKNVFEDRSTKKAKRQTKKNDDETTVTHLNMVDEWRSKKKSVTPTFPGRYIRGNMAFLLF